MIYRYKCVKIGRTEEETEDILNELSQDGWRLVCPYYQGYYLILEKMEDDGF
jgi:hypothetical protein